MDTETVEMVVTVVLVGVNSPADVVRLVNVALQSATVRDVRVEKKRGE